MAFPSWSLGTREETSYNIQPQYIRTLLRLQFFGDHRVPTEIQSDNIASWYALWSPSAAIAMADAQGKQLGEKILVPKNWNIFVVFQKPTKFREIVIDFSSPGFPQYEVKQATSKSVVISVSGDIPAGAFELYAKQ